MWAIPPVFLAFSLLAICLIFTIGLLTKHTNIVYISDSQGYETMAIGLQTDTERLMKLSGIETTAVDEVYYTSYSGNLANLNIQRAFEVSVVADGKTSPLSLTEGTVSDALDMAGVKLGALDYTEPSLHTPLTEGVKITVHRVEYKDSVAYEEIPFETEYVYTSLFLRKQSTQMTLQTGITGEKAITSRERWVDGELESSQVSGVEITSEPQTQILKVYGAYAPVSSRTGPDGTTNKPSTYTQVLTGRATGYSSSGGRGSSGLGLDYGTVAVNPNVIPYGTLMYIESTDGRFVYGYAIATDTGTALMNGTCLVDLYYQTYEESLLNAVHTVNVYVVG